MKKRADLISLVFHVVAGKWQRVRVEKGLSDVEWLQKDGGLLAFHLSSSPSLTLGVHDVEVNRTALHFPCSFAFICGAERCSVASSMDMHPLRQMHHLWPVSFRAYNQLFGGNFQHYVWQQQS